MASVTVDISRNLSLGNGLVSIVEGIVVVIVVLMSEVMTSVNHFGLICTL